MDRRRLLWLLLGITAASALTVVLVPAWVIQPFRPQSPRGLEISYSLRRLAPIFTILALLVAVVLMIRLWRASRWWSKPVLIILTLITAVSTWFARQNHFEWMFNPLANAAYAGTSAAGFVNDSDLVIAVERGGESAAYPIRQLAYHHLVQDTVGQVPIVVTY